MDSVKPARPVRRAIGLAALAASLSPAAFAQQPPVTPPAPETVIAPDAKPASAEGVQTFDAAYFHQYNPVTAADIVNRVPGFEIDDGEALRGFGATAGNVLVNGERPSSKVLVSEQLKRIPAESVIRVELISGSASNVDVRGQTQLVNVILKQANQSGSPTTWVLDVRDIQYSERVGWGVQLTKSFALGPDADLTLDFQLPNLRGRSESFETVRNAAGTIIELREQNGQPNNIGVQGSAVLKWRLTPQDAVSFNAQVAPTWNTTNFTNFSFTPAGVIRSIQAGLSEYENNYTAEIGGDWEHRFSPELSVKGIALATFTNVDQDDIFLTYTPTGTAGPGGLFNTRTQARTTEAGERLGRGFLTWRPTSAHTIDAGVEGAFNFRDTTFDVFSDSGAGPQPVGVPVSDTRVEETRIEPFITDVWKISPQLTLETGFIYESSTIKQTGDEQKEREFSYPKPRAILTWQATEADQARFTLAREVAQLDFAEFASSVNFLDSSSLIGNPDLEPEKSWRARAEWEHKFGARAALTLALFHDQVEDTQDFIPRTICIVPLVAGVCPTGSLRTFDAPGNIGDGTRTGVEVRGALPLAPLLPNAEIRFSGLWQETDVTDPITGENRRFSSERDWNYNVSFRHDLPEHKLAWGASAMGQSDRYDFKVAEDILSDRPGTRADLFVESPALIPGVTVRVTASNIFHPEETRVRTFYQSDPLDPVAAPRSTGIIRQTDERKQKGGPEGTQVFSVRFSGTF
jgi:outer membrane receptor for ferrienterochelin and colicin